LPTTAHRTLKIIAFDANGIARQAYEVRKQFQDLEIGAALFSETHLKLATTYLFSYEQK
jgi:hypothetical protein